MDETYYKESLVKYSNTIRLAIKISRLAARRQVEDKIAWACILYTRLCVTGMSIYILAPESDIADKKIDHWDFSSLFSLTRNIMECYQTLFYLCIDNVPEDELKARRKLFNLHDCYSRKTLFSFTEEKQEDKSIEELVIKELTETTYFKSLNDRQQKHFLRGENAFFISREEIEERFGTKRDDFKLLYKLFSSNTHSFPMGFYRMYDGSRGRGIKSDTEVGYNALALETSEQYIRQASNNILSFFQDIQKQLTKTEKKSLA